MAVYPPIYGASVCSGIGGLDLAVSILLPDYRCILYCEREVTAAEILVTRMEEGSIPPALIWDDLATLPSGQFRGSVSILTAGLPCQPFSVAGKQRGDKDDRYIWPAFFRIVSEMQPAVVVLENVPGFTKWFRPIGEELCGLGYEFEAGLFSAGEVGASHKRLRFFALCWRPSDPRSSELIRALANPGARPDDLAVPRGIRSGPWGTERQGFGGWAAPEQPDGNVGHAEGNDQFGDTMPGLNGQGITPRRSGGFVADAARDERPGPHREAGPGRGVREASERGSYQLANDPQSRSWRVSEPDRWHETANLDGISGALADADQRRCGERPDAAESEPAGRSGARVHPGSGDAVVHAHGAERRESGIEGHCGCEGIDAGWEEDNRTGIAVEVLDNTTSPRSIRRQSGQGTEIWDAAWRGEPGRRRNDMADAGCAGNDGRPEKPARLSQPGSSGNDSRTGRALGHADDAGLEGRLQCGYGPDQRATGATGDPELADTGSQQPEPDTRRWPGPGETKSSGAFSGATGCGDNLPLFAPGPGVTEVWQDVLVQYPWLRPAISQAEVEQLIHALADGPAATLAGSRTDQLRACGNAVVPLQAALALRLLARRAGLI